MRDILTIPFDGEDSLIIASDNSGAIGMMEDDIVRVPYDMVAYYSFRVAVLECMAAGGHPISVVLHNFCGNEPWDDLMKGIKKGLFELNLLNVSITGSTESNFSLRQSALGLVVLGKKTHVKKVDLTYNGQLNFAVIGKPLVGNEVVEQKDNIAPLSIFQELSMIEGMMIWPVGSKGILYEMNQMFQNEKFSEEMIRANVDVLKSSGPATCFIVVYYAEHERKLKQLAGNFFNSVQIKRKLENTDN